MLQKACKRMNSIASETREYLIAIAGDRLWSETREAWLARAARQCGISFRSARSLFYGTMPNPRADFVERIRIAAEKLEKQKAETARFERENTDGEYRHMVEEIKRAHAKIEDLHAQIKAIAMRD